MPLMNMPRNSVVGDRHQPRPHPVQRPPLSDKKDDPALSSGASQQSPSASEEQVSQQPFSGSAPVGNDTHQAETPNEHREDDRGLALGLRESPAENFDERANQLTRGRESCMGD